MTIAALVLAGTLATAALPGIVTSPRDRADILPVRVFEVLQPARFDPTRFDSVTAGALRLLLDSAAAQGLPTGPLVNNAFHGSALRVPGPRIVSQVRAHFMAMLDARAALGENASESELDSGADAIRQGIDGKALVAVRATRPATGTAVSALVVLTDLVKRGIPTGKARDAVTALARVSRSDDGINGLQAMVARNAERGPGMAQDALERYLRSNVPGSSKNAPAKPATRPPSPPDVS